MSRRYGRAPDTPSCLEDNPGACPYCGSFVVYKDSSVIYGKSYGMAWICANYPECDSYVGCHPGTRKPLGRIANKELRIAKSRVHKLFDPLWQAKVKRDSCSIKSARSAGYVWLASRLGIPVEKCHVGMFDLKLCAAAVVILSSYYRR